MAYSPGILGGKALGENPFGRVAEALARVIREFGTLIASDPARLRSVLSDLLAEDAVGLRTEINAVVAAAAAGVATTIRDSTGEPDVQALTQRLVDSGINPVLAANAVQAWGASLGTQLPATELPGTELPPTELPGTELPPTELPPREKQDPIPALAAPGNGKKGKLSRRTALAWVLVVALLASAGIAFAVTQTGARHVAERKTTPQTEITTGPTTPASNPPTLSPTPSPTGSHSSPSPSSHASPTPTPTRSVSHLPKPGNKTQPSAGATDKVAPVVTKPVAQVLFTDQIATQLVGSTGVYVSVNGWSVSDSGGSKLKGYELWQSTDGSDWSPIQANSTAQVKRLLQTGHQYQFAASAIDNAGNSSYAIAGAFKVAIHQENWSGIAYHYVSDSQAWKSQSDSNYSGGRVYYSSEDGSDATVSFCGFSVGWVGNRFSSGGTAYVTTGSSATTKVVTAYSKWYPRSVNYYWRGASGSHTLQIVISGSKSVDIDAIVVLTNIGTCGQ